MEAANAAEDLEKDILRDVGGVGGILQAARDQRVELLVVSVDQLRKGLLGAALKLGHKGGFIARKANRDRQIIHCYARLHLRVPLAYDFAKMSVNLSQTGLNCFGSVGTISEPQDLELREESASPATECSLTHLFRHRKTGIWFPLVRK